MKENSRQLPGQPARPAPIYTADSFEEMERIVRHVLTDAQGAHLDDRPRLFNAGLDGKAWRAIDLYEADTLDGTASPALIREASDCNAKPGS